MPATLIIAPPAAGKTTHCLARLRAGARESAAVPVWAVLPDRVQVRYFRRRLAEEGGGLGVRIGTFGDLYRTILDAAGRPVPEADTSLIYRLVSTAIADEASRGSLVHYAPIASMPGFTENARKAIGELKSARVSPERFLAECGEDPRVREIGQIYAAYQARLQAMGWADPEGLNWLAVEALEHEPGLLADWPLVVVDGFDDFETTRRNMLAALAGSVSELIVTLPGSSGFTRPAHLRFKRAFDTLAAFMEVAHLAPPDPPHLVGDLARIERDLFEARMDPAIVDPTVVVPLPPPPGDPSISFVELASPAEEAREALRWVKARLVRDHVQLRDCLIVTPEPELYRPLLREAAAEFGLPITFTEGEALITTPAATALADLLDLPRLDYPHRLLADTLRSPYFRLPGFEQGDADAVEAVSRTSGSSRGLQRWLAVLDRRAVVAEESGDLDGRDGGDVEGGSDLPRGRRAERLRKALAEFAELLVAPGMRSTREWVTWLEDTLDRLGFTHAAVAGLSPGTRPWVDAAARRDRQVFEALEKLLRAVVVAETAIEEISGAVPPRDYASFAGELRGMIETVTFRDEIDDRQDDDAPNDDRRDPVLVTKVLESRGPRFKAVVMVGLSEGQFPQPETEDPLLDEDLRERLGLEQRLDREQRALFYLVSTRAGGWLRFSRPYLSGKGETWDPSPYWKAALSALGRDDATVQRTRPDDPRAIQDAASTAELLFWLVRKKGIPPPIYAGYADVRARWHDLKHARDVMRDRLAPHPTGPFEGDASALSEMLTAWHSPAHTWSPSRLETYGSCGLRFFTESLLGLEETVPPEPGPDARQLGTLLHGILETAYKSVDEPGDPDVVIAALRPIAAAEFAEAPLKYGFEPTAYWQAEEAAWREQLELMVRELAQPPGQWQPVGFELVFGSEGVPPLVVETGDPAVGAVRVRGVIDRVDRDGAGNLRVVDYKTGSGHQAAGDLVAGRRLQLPLYALAARQDPEHGGNPIEGLYWAIRAGKAGSLRLSRFKVEHDGIAYEGPEGAADLVRVHIARTVGRVRAGQFAPEPPAGGCPDYCAAKAWCWRYEPGRSR
jgi:ATP-dependent helicase/DNAse subunit B